MDYSKACSEVDFILEHISPEDKERIPDKVINFFKDNKSFFYKTNIDTNKKLKDQDISDETKAFLKIIYYKYFANEEQKKEFEKMLNKEESNEIFDSKAILEEPKENINMQNKMIEYKDNINIFQKIWGWIKKWIRK